MSAADRAPWIVSATAAAVTAALAIVFFAVLLPDRDAPLGALTGEEKAAVDAAGTEAANVLSYRRAHFDADFDRALKGATGALRSDLRSKRASTEKVLTQGKFDLSAKVDRAALVGRPENGSKTAYVVLVALNGFQSTHPGVAIPSRLAVTVQRTKGTWLVSDITSVGVDQ